MKLTKKIWTLAKLQKKKREHDKFLHCVDRTSDEIPGPVSDPDIYELAVINSHIPPKPQ